MTAIRGPIGGCDVAVMGTGMTDMSRRDLSPAAMGHQVVHEALTDAGIAPDQLGLVVVGNALAGRLNDQGNVRGQAWLHKADLGDVAVVNVDNSCAGGSSSLHVGVMAARATGRPVLVVGIEKMWTGDRALTLAAIEDGLEAGYRADMHASFRAAENPGGSVLMGLNAVWAKYMVDERGATPEQFAAAAAKARRHGALNPLAQHQQEVTADEVLASPPISGVLTRLMCSSFTDGAAAMVLVTSDSEPSRHGTGNIVSKSPRIIGAVARSGNGEFDYHERLETTASAAWDEFGIGPRDVDLVELHDATSAEELYALESLGFFGPGESGPATLRGDTGVGSPGLTVNTSGGLVGRGHPLGATGIAQVVELVTQMRGRAGGRQTDDPRLGVAVNTGGLIHGDAAFVGMFAVAAGS